MTKAKSSRQQCTQTCASFVLTIHRVMPSIKLLTVDMERRL